MVILFTDNLLYYAISEEEGEQVGEAEEFCRGLRTNLKGSLHLNEDEQVGFNRESHQQRKPQGRKGKEKIKELEGRKGKEKIKDLKNNVGKQVWGICLSEEDKRRVYMGSPKLLHSLYEYITCSENNQGKDDGLMFLCDFCDSPAHTYCGNWYCGGCTQDALGSSCSQVQERVDDSRVTCQSLLNRPSPVAYVRQSIDPNLMSSPFNQGFGNLSSIFSGRSVEGTSLVSSGGAPTLSERIWITPSNSTTTSIP